MALIPSSGTPNATVALWLAGRPFPDCPAQVGPNPIPIDPVTIAVNYWRTIPLPVPKPAIPPGYGITGKVAYLVTHGTVAPAPYLFNTPLGRLTIDATGRYLVNWGDPNQPGWAGPYSRESQPWPDGQITHGYDFAGTYTVTVEEQWSARWQLAGATGTLTGLHTTATIPDFRVEQLQAVITN